MAKLDLFCCYLYLIFSTSSSVTGAPKDHLLIFQLGGEELKQYQIPSLPLLEPLDLGVQFNPDSSSDQTVCHPGSYNLQCLKTSKNRPTCYPGSTDPSCSQNLQRNAYSPSQSPCFDCSPSQGQLLSYSTNRNIKELHLGNLHVKYI